MRPHTTVSTITALDQSQRLHPRPFGSSVSHRGVFVRIRGYVYINRRTAQRRRASRGKGCMRVFLSCIIGLVTKSARKETSMDTSCGLERPPVLTVTHQQENMRS